MADSQRLLLSLIDKLLDDVRMAAAETKSLSRVVAHICHIDNGDAQSAAVYLKERDFSGHADRLTQDVDGLLQKADEVFREPFVAEPTPDDRKQEKRYLRGLCSEAHRLLRFLNDMRSLVDEDDDPKRQYTKKVDAERIAKEKFNQLWPIDNKSEWARQIGCNRDTVPKLLAWQNAKKRREGWMKIETRLKGVVDPAIIEALVTSDASALAKLSTEDRDKLDSMPDQDRAEMIELLQEQARDAIS